MSDIRLQLDCTRTNVAANVTCTTEGQTQPKLVKSGEMNRFNHLEFDTVNCTSSTEECIDVTFLHWDVKTCDSNDVWFIRQCPPSWFRIKLL